MREIILGVLKHEIKKRRNIVVITEASETGFGVYSDDLPGVSGYGKTVADAKKECRMQLLNY